MPEAIKRYFIADLHLNGQPTEHARNFHAFLKALGREAAGMPVELYVLGDLFSFWYEYRRALFEVYAADLAAMEQAARAGVKFFIINGNRDFAYGAYLPKRMGATILGDTHTLTLGDYRPAWLEHGDLLCTGDRRYRLFRSAIRSAPVRVLFWLTPWAVAKRLIGGIRRVTSADKRTKPEYVFAVDLDAARRRLEQSRCRVLLCGHFHQECREDLGAGYQLIVLPPWCEQPSGMLDCAGTFKPFTFQVSNEGSGRPD